MIWFGSVSSVHSNLPPKSELNIFDFKNSKPNPNRTKTKPKIWQQFCRFLPVCLVVMSTTFLQQILNGRLLLIVIVGAKK